MARAGFQRRGQRRAGDVAAGANGEVVGVEQPQAAWCATRATGVHAGAVANGELVAGGFDLAACIVNTSRCAAALGEDFAIHTGDAAALGDV